ncbi:DNA-binding protein [Microbacterium sp. nov. GSS16]|uniref:DNA-binding protein n=1 Tax=Microbacterium sp. nov. GSS16 TaxID=3019890 RepID=UPI003FA5CED6
MINEATPEARIHAATDEVDREGVKPAVASVRERASVNNADATRYLRQWREGRAASAATIAALPAALVEHSQRVAGRRRETRCGRSRRRGLGRDVCGREGSARG